MPVLDVTVPGLMFGMDAPSLRFAARNKDGIDMKYRASAPVSDFQVTAQGPTQLSGLITETCKEPPECLVGGDGGVFQATFGATLPGVYLIDALFRKDPGQCSGRGST
jgi:hypothetical protein